MMEKFVVYLVERVVMGYSVDNIGATELFTGLFRIISEITDEEATKVVDAILPTNFEEHYQKLCARPHTTKEYIGYLPDDWLNEPTYNENLRVKVSLTSGEWLQ
jgi:hypothetical protein